MANGPTKNNLPGLVKRTPQQLISAISRPDLTTIYQQPQVSTAPTAYVPGSTIGRGLQSLNTGVQPTTPYDMNYMQGSGNAVNSKYTGNAYGGTATTRMANRNQDYGNYMQTGKFNPVTEVTQGLGMEDLISKYSPEQLGQMDFSKVAAGTYGTDPKGYGLGQMFTDVGGAKGVSDLAGAASTIYGMYNDYQQNKRADRVLDAQMQDRSNQYKANADWNKNIAASGLGTASRAVL